MQAEQGGGVPYSEAMEQALLGSALYSPPLITDIAVFITREDFFLVKHGEIFAALVAAFQMHGRYDIALIADSLRARGLLESIGGAAYLQELVVNCPDPYNWKAYSDQVHDDALRRRLMTASERMRGIVADRVRPVIETAQQMEATLYNATSRISRRTTELGFRDELLAWHDNPQDVRGYRTGIGALDKLTGGFGESGLVILLAYSGAGKSTMLAEWMLNLCQQGTGLIAATEMSPKQWQQRLVAQLLNSNMDTMRRGRFDSRDRLAQMCDYVESLPIQFVRQGKPTGDELISKVRRTNPDWVIVDGLSDMGGDPNSDLQRTNRNIDALHTIYRELGKLVLSSVQMNTDSKHRAIKEPNARDAAWAPSRIWQLSTHYLILHRPALLVETGEVEDAKHEIDPEACFVRVAKDRWTGHTGRKVDLKFVRKEGLHGFFEIEDKLAFLR